jgi:hypothetical protein
MGKISIGLRGWRFDEEEVIDENGEIRPLEQMEPDTRYRIVRLTTLVGEPCDACWLIHGQENAARCNPTDVVYGEVLGEVTVCAEHEADFLYWYREAGGSQYRGEKALQDEFHEWFADGGRAPEGYGGIEHVETDPDSVPNPDMHRELPSLEEEIDELDDETIDDMDLDLSDLDI